MNRNAANFALHNVLNSYRPNQTYKFGTRFVDSLPEPILLDIRLDPLPFTGLVIGHSDDAIFVTSGSYRVDMVSRADITILPAVGTYVEVAAYTRRNFQGVPLRIVNLGEESAYAETLRPSQVLSYRGAIKLPIPAQENEYLFNLVHQLEHLPAPDQFRSIAHLLVDANAKDFEVCDPDYEAMRDTPPSICFNVESKKYRGGVKITFDYGRDYYIFSLHQDGTIINEVKDVCWEDLGGLLADTIDDGEWRKIKITPLPMPDNVSHLVWFTNGRQISNQHLS